MEKEREREVLESSGKQIKKKGEDGDIWVYMCGGEKSREKKKKNKKKEMYGRVERNKGKIQFRNVITIFSQ